MQENLEELAAALYALEESNLLERDPWRHAGEAVRRAWRRHAAWLIKELARRGVVLVKLSELMELRKQVTGGAE